MCELDNYQTHFSKLERITRRWWFIMPFVLIPFVIPPYASKSYPFPERCLEVALQGLANPIYSFFEYRVAFKVVPILLIVALILAPKRVTRFFNIYVAISCLFFALYHGIGKTQEYGVVINIGNLMMFLTVSASWFWEVFVQRNNFSSKKQPFWKYWIAPLVLLAFWFPVNRQTLMSDFNPIYFFTNGAGLAFCTMTPLYIGVLTVYYPTINSVTLRVTSIVGLSAALANMHLEFVKYPDTMWWVGVLHLPLLIISVYGLLLSLKRRMNNNITNSKQGTQWLN